MKNGKKAGRKSASPQGAASHLQDSKDAMAQWMAATSQIAREKFPSFPVELSMSQADWLSLHRVAAAKGCSVGELVVRIILEPLTDLENERGFAELR